MNDQTEGSDLSEDDRPTPVDSEPPPSWAVALQAGIAAVHADVRVLSERLDWLVKIARDNADGLARTNQHFREAIDKLGERVHTVERRVTPPPMPAVRLPDIGNGNGAE